jgi:hypothetical protein
MLKKSLHSSSPSHLKDLIEVVTKGFFILRAAGRPPKLYLS